MNINDDFTNKAEAEMKMHDAKMMEQAMIKKLAGEPLEKRIAFALTKRNSAVEALDYMRENHMIKDNEQVTVEMIESLKK